MPGKRHFNSLSNFPHPHSFENREKKKSWKGGKSYSEQSSGDGAVLVGVAATKDEEGETDWDEMEEEKEREREREGFHDKNFLGEKEEGSVPPPCSFLGGAAASEAVKEREHGKLFYYPLLLPPTAAAVQLLPYLNSGERPAPDDDLRPRRSNLPSPLPRYNIRLFNK